MARGRLIDPTDITSFIYGGRARFTLVSKVAGHRYTYKVSRSHDRKVFFVSVQSTACAPLYSYIGFVKPYRAYLNSSREAKLPRDDLRVKAFAWYLVHVGDGRVEFWHEGRCGRCGRPLTVPSSIERGLGPVCGGPATDEVLERVRVERMTSSVGRILAGDVTAIDDLKDPGL